MHNKSSLYVYLFLALLCSSELLAQNYEVSTYQKTNAHFEYLLLSNSQISKNDTINEKLVDLVVPTLADSIIDRKKQHHKLGPIGWFIHTFGGFNWRALSMKKEKFVGTVVRQSRSSEEQFTEYDINFDLNFHLDKYLYRVFYAYDRQAKIKRQDITSKHKNDYKASPFVRDSQTIDIRQYRLHCELTPEKAYRGLLNAFFYPTLPGGGGLKGHPNFENEYPSVGFYGTFCLDCNHSCHPELHPYEWMWWLKCNDEDVSLTKEWYFGLFHEGSNRMKKWSVNPLLGSIRIPFAFRKEGVSSIEVEHLVFNQFVEDGLEKSTEKKFGPNQQQQKVRIEGQALNKEIDIYFKQPLHTKGLQYWMDEINYDAEQSIVSGYLYIAISVKDLYSCRVRFN